MLKHEFNNMLTPILEKISLENKMDKQWEISTTTL